MLNYDGKCKHLHGHNGKVEIEVSSGQLDCRGMVVDFGEINQIVKVWIDNTLDHKMLLSKDDPLAALLLDSGEPCFLMDSNPTAENIARMIFDYAVSQGLPVAEVKLWETATSFATYRADNESG